MHIEPTDFSIKSFLLRSAVAIASAAVIGVGATAVATKSEADKDHDKIEVLEKELSRLPDIDRNVIALTGKVDVLNQKIDDVKENANGRVR